MTLLSLATLDRVPAAIPAPRGRPPLRTGIVHFGPGAFHRAHQADYVDRLLDGDPRWGIAAVSLRSRDTVAALAAQDGLYALAIRDRENALRVNRAHTAFLGPEDGTAVHALLVDPAVALVTSTVTEKGYCLAADGTLDLSHRDIVHDLSGARVPRSLIGWLVAGLGARRAAGLAPFVAMPCDNLPANGRKLHAALIAFAAVREPALAAWIADEVRAPSTMVDSITPASDAALLKHVEQALGVTDHAAVQREAFAQWVIEDVGPVGPDLAAAGAIVTKDVAGYERAKLRILNGAHSTLAYAGLLRGHATVAEAMADAALAGFVTAMIRDEIIPAIAPIAGLDLKDYAATVLDRFRNPLIVHRLDQIAQDGSQKLPHRLWDTIAFHRARGRAPRRLLTVLGVWVEFLRREIRDGRAIADPLGERIAALAGQEPAAAVRGLAAAGIGIAPGIADDPASMKQVVLAAEAAATGDWPAFLS